MNFYENGKLSSPDVREKPRCLASFGKAAGITPEISGLIKPKPFAPSFFGRKNYFSLM
jgi:hypothetical protein